MTHKTLYDPPGMVGGIALLYYRKENNNIIIHGHHTHTHVYITLSPRLSLSQYK